MTKLFVWDLHGTLEQGNEHAAIEISNKILRDFGYSDQFSPKHVAELYGLKWYQYFEALLPQESHERHVELQAACFDFSNSDEGVNIIARHIQPSRNALEVLKAIHTTHNQVLISNTTPASLPIFIKALGITEYFDTLNAIAVNQHAREAKHTKQDALKDFLKDTSYREFIVIGDSESDMQFALDAKAKGYLYAHAGTSFRSQMGDRRINDLKELLQEI